MEKYQGYYDREEFKNMTNRELLQLQKKKITQQDEQIDELIGVVKKGNITAKELGTEIEKQNVKLEKLDEEIQSTESKMVKTRKKFENFIEKSSFCCLYVVIIVEIVVLALVLLLA